MQEELPKRKRNRLENYDYSSSGLYFITICTKDRKNLLWSQSHPNLVGEDIILPLVEVPLSPIGKIVDEAITTLPQKYPKINVLQYVIMPNHVHLILYIPYERGRIISSPTSILTAVGQMKRATSKKTGYAFWQRSFHEHVIRHKNDFDKISKYIYENPIKWKEDCFYNEQ